MPILRTSSQHNSFVLMCVVKAISFSRICNVINILRIDYVYRVHPLIRGVCKQKFLLLHSAIMWYRFELVNSRVLINQKKGLKTHVLPVWPISSKIIPHETRQQLFLSSYDEESKLYKKLSSLFPEKNCPVAKEARVART